MCGIVGFIGDWSSHSDTKMFKSLLHMDVVRGKDSTGIYSIGSKYTKWHKSLNLPTAFLEEQATQEVLTNAHWGVIGHNRAATLGAVNKDNAHPFHHNGITLVHNGTLYQFPDIKDKEQDFDTDSETIAFGLSECESHEERVKFLEKIDGAFALVWFDTKEDCFFVIRNDERPLHYMEVANVKGKDNSRGMWLSSEAGILYACAKRHGYKIDPEIQIQEFEEGYLYRIESNHEGVTYTREKLNLLDTYTYGNGWWTSYSTGKSQSSSSYKGSGVSNIKSKTNTLLERNLEEHLGLVSGAWYAASAVRFDAYKSSSGFGTLHVRLHETGCNAVLYGVLEPKMSDDIDVLASGLSMTSYDNSRVKKKSDYTILAKSWEYALATNDIPFGVTDDPVDDTSSTFECINCFAQVTMEECIIVDLNRNHCVCDDCIKHDATARDYAQTHREDITL